MIIPALHRILVRPDKFEETDESFKRAKASGIIIPELEANKRAQASVDTGTVLAIGETAFRDFGTVSPIQPNDRIAYAKFSGKYIKDPETNEEFVILNDEDVCVIFK